MRKKVLIVDENALNRRFFRDVLRSEGFDTIMSGSGGEARALACAEMPDLIIMDMCVRDIDALHATRGMKNDARTADIPVIGVSAKSQSLHFDEARAEGCAECLLKPVSVSGFLRSVNRYLN